MHGPCAPLVLAVALLAPACRSGSCCPAGVPASCPTAVGVVQAPEPQVLVEMTLLELSEAQIAAHLAVGVGGSGPRRVLSAAQAAAFLNAIRAEPTREVVQMPSIVTASGEDAIVEIQEAEPSARWSGMRVAVSPRVHSDREQLELDVQASRRPPSGAAAAAQQVETKASRLHSQETLILLGPPDAVTGRRFLATVRPTILPAP
jgi:hypothetical protein